MQEGCPDRRKPLITKDVYVWRQRITQKGRIATTPRRVRFSHTCPNARQVKGIKSMRTMQAVAPPASAHSLTHLPTRTLPRTLTPPLNPNPYSDTLTHPLTRHPFPPPADGAVVVELSRVGRPAGRSDGRWASKCIRVRGAVKSASKSGSKCIQAREVDNPPVPPTSSANSRRHRHCPQSACRRGGSRRSRFRGSSLRQQCAETRGRRRGTRTA